MAPREPTPVTVAAPDQSTDARHDGGNRAGFATGSAERFRVLAWWDPDLAIHGHDPISAYQETYWLPVLGPATTLAHRWFVQKLRREPEGFEMEVSELARSLGLGTAKGRNAPAPRAMQRLCHFGLARWDPAGLEVRTHVPVLPAHLARRLPRALRADHDAAESSRSSRSAPQPRRS